MADSRSALVPKQRVLNEHETESSFTTWLQSMQFNIAVDGKFSRYLDKEDLGEWSPSSIPTRGFTNDAVEGENVLPKEVRMTAVQKEMILKILLGSISSFAPVVSNKFITEQATSLQEIFNRLRSHYGFRSTGGRILELAQFSLLPDESYESLWERLSAFVDDNLLKVAGEISHRGEMVISDEEPCPTLENVTVVLWLKAINPDLPMMIKQRFSTQLRNTTLFSLREEISEAIPSVLADLQDKEYTVSYTRNYKPGKTSQRMKPQRKFQSFKNKNCCLCEAAKRPGSHTHFLSECIYLPAEDKRFMSKIREINIDESSDEEHDPQTNSINTTPNSCRVDVMPSPILQVNIFHTSANITLDSGAEVNLIEESECKRLNLQITPTHQRASMADGSSPLQVVGEVNFKCTRDHHALKFSGLVVGKLNCPILAGMPFLVTNDVFVRPRECSIYLGDCCTIRNVPKKSQKSNVSRHATILKVSQKTCILPGEDIPLQVPSEYCNQEIAIEPRLLSPCYLDVPNWLTCKTTIPNADGAILIENTSDEPVLLRKNEQFAQLYNLEDGSDDPLQTDLVPTSVHIRNTKSHSTPFSDTVQIDPASETSIEERSVFKKINMEYDEVFSNQLGCYNGASGPFSHVITVGDSLPPQRRGRIPTYNTKNMELLQMKYDELTAQGVFAKPEDIGVNVEYVNPSFLIKKPDSSHRLVTAFNELGEHTRPQQCAMPNVDQVLRQIAEWKHIVKTDLKSAYYQIPLSKDSMRFCGVVTPFRGTLVYQRAVMGLPGSEASLECLLSRILGDLMMKGTVVKLSDDLYIGSNSIEETQKIWAEVLRLLQKNGLKLSPSKTVCCPASTVILGWLWEHGTIRPTPHRINTLAQCDPPDTVHKLRSFIGAYKFLAKVLPHHADHLDPFEKLCASNKSGSDKIDWTEELLIQFNRAKSHLASAKTLTLPKRDDSLQIITDASSNGIASAMYCLRDGKPHLAGLFNAKRKSHQLGWLPCEAEALSITASVKHFGPYIIQSNKKTQVHTDSLPCVNAFKKLSRGQFSSSPRVTTFLSTLSHYAVELFHIPGKHNILSDFASRHTLECNGSCQICTFIDETENSVVNSISVTDILHKGNNVPYSSRNAWYKLQQDCPDIQKAIKHLKSGTSPGRKSKGVKDIKRYINVAKLSTYPADGLLIVPANNPLQQSRHRIVVPREVVDGLLTALHLKLTHPSKDQLKQIFNRAFFALDLEKAAGRVTTNCHVCKSLKKVPSQLIEQTTGPAPQSIGVKYSADVIKRERQNILIIREYVSSITDATFIKSESGPDLKEGLLQLLSRLRTSTGPPVTVRVDPASGFQRIVNDQLLTSINISLETGEPKNLNKNPVSEKSISEFLEEIAKLQPHGGPITQNILSLAIGNINGRIRGNGLSSIEIWTKRNMTNGDPVNINDEDLIRMKQEERYKNHQSSEKYKARGKTQMNLPPVELGDVVYLYSDREKGRCRDNYLVVAICDKDVVLQKFVGSQLRSKRYKVKITDIITVKQHPVTENKASESDNQSEYGKITYQFPSNGEQNKSDEESASESVSQDDTSDEELIEVGTPPIEDIASGYNRPRRETRKPSRYDDFILNDSVQLVKVPHHQPHLLPFSHQYVCSIIPVSQQYNPVWYIPCYKDQQISNNGVYTGNSDQYMNKQ